jgi:hypothetical protein
MAMHEIVTSAPPELVAPPSEKLRGSDGRKPSARDCRNSPHSDQAGTCDRSAEPVERAIVSPAWGYRLLGRRECCHSAATYVI